MMRVTTEAGPGADALVALWTAITQRVLDYGFKLEYARLERPKLGIFDGQRIVIDPAVDFEMQCFLVLHLFGHSVQWVAPSYRPEILAVPEPERRPRSLPQGAGVLRTKRRQVRPATVARIGRDHARPVVLRLRGLRLEIRRSVLPNRPHPDVGIVPGARRWPDRAALHPPAGASARGRKVCVLARAWVG